MEERGLDRSGSKQTQAVVNKVMKSQFHKMRGIFLVAQELLDFHEGLGFMELVHLVGQLLGQLSLAIQVAIQLLSADRGVREFQDVGFKTARLLRFQVLIRPVACISVSFECLCCVSSGPCDGPIPRPEKSYQVLCVIKCDRVQQQPSTPTVSRQKRLD